MLQHDPHGERANKHIDEVFDLYEDDFGGYGQEGHDDGYISEEIKEDDRMRRKGAFIFQED